MGSSGCEEYPMPTQAPLYSPRPLTPRPFCAHSTPFTQAYTAPPVPPGFAPFLNGPLHKKPKHNSPGLLLLHTFLVRPRLLACHVLCASRPSCANVPGTACSDPLAAGIPRGALRRPGLASVEILPAAAQEGGAQPLDPYAEHTGALRQIQVQIQLRTGDSNSTASDI